MNTESASDAVLGPGCQRLPARLWLASSFLKLALASLSKAPLPQASKCERTFTLKLRRTSASAPRRARPRKPSKPQATGHRRRPGAQSCRNMRRLLHLLRQRNLSTIRSLYKSATILAQQESLNPCMISKSSEWPRSLMPQSRSACVLRGGRCSHGFNFRWQCNRNHVTKVSGLSGRSPSSNQNCHAARYIRARGG